MQKYTRTKFYLRNDSKHFLQTTTRETIANNTCKVSSDNHFKQYLQFFIREITENICYKLLPEKSFQTILKTYNFKQYTYIHTILREIIPNLQSYNYYKRNHCKQYLQYLKTIITEIIANYAYKSLSENSINFKYL